MLRVRTVQSSGVTLRVDVSIDPYMRVSHVFPAPFHRKICLKEYIINLCCRKVRHASFTKRKRTFYKSITNDTGQWSEPKTSL